MRTWIAAVILLGLGVSTEAQFPNNYAATMTATWNKDVGTIDPAVGKTPGTVLITVTFSGSTQNQAMNNSGVHHTPTAQVKVGSQTQGIQGPGFLPAQNMNWSKIFSFDLEAAGCDFQVLETGTCEADNQSFVTCPQMGFIGIHLQKIQFEIANTTSEVVPGTRGWNGVHYFYDAVSFCTAITAPPDFPGPDIVYQDIDPLGAYLRTQDLCWRTAAWGQDFTGLPWSCANVPRSGYLSYIQMVKHLNAPELCTNKDGGFQPSF